MKIDVTKSIIVMFCYGVLSQLKIFPGQRLVDISILIPLLTVHQIFTCSCTFQYIKYSDKKRKQNNQGKLIVQNLV